MVFPQPCHIAKNIHVAGYMAKSGGETAKSKCVISLSGRGPCGHLDPRSCRVNAGNSCRKSIMNFTFKGRK